MRNPVTLLCLADLHCEEQEFTYFSDLADTLWYFTRQFKNAQWEPDYLVVAGDIVFAKRETENKTDQINKYKQAERVIDKLIERFPHLWKHIVFVPGNHDTTIPEDLSKISKERQTFSDYCKKIDNTQIVYFSGIFKNRFKLYLNFVRKYKPRTRYKNKKIIKHNIRNLAGVRVFPKDNLCFVPINTEWLYISGKAVKRLIKKDINEDLLKLLNETKDTIEKIPSPSAPIKNTCSQLVELCKNTSKDFTYKKLLEILDEVINIAKGCSFCSLQSTSTDTFRNLNEIRNKVVKKNNLLNILDESVDVLERSSLCSPLIKDAYLKLVELHKRENFTVVTVMHRGPEYLPYEDKNPTDKAKPDSLGKILHLSDILLTGHEHQTRTDAPPSYIGKGVLHFNLGSAGRKERETSEHIRWAALIHIDPISGSVEHLPIEYNNENQKWELLQINSYPLRNNYDISTLNKDSWEYNGSIPVLHVRSRIKDIIEGRIRNYFGIDENDKNICVIDADLWNGEKIENMSINREQMRVIIYYRATQTIHRGLKNEDEQVKIMKKIDEFRANHIECILLNKLIINEIIIK